MRGQYPQCLIDPWIGQTAGNQRGHAEIVHPAVITRYGHGECPGRGRRPASDVAVFEYHHFGRRNPKTPRRGQVDFRIRLALGNILGGQNELEPFCHVKRF